MSEPHIDEAARRIGSVAVDRRTFVQRASGLGVSVGAHGLLVAHSAGEAVASSTPAADAHFPPIAPPTRDEVLAQIRDEYDLSTPRVTGGQLIFGQRNDIATVNPLTATDIYSGLVVNWVYQLLISINPIDGSFTPGLADTWMVAPDGRSYTFKLNPDVRWHDGMPFTADDVIFSFDAVLDEASLSPRRSSVMQYLESWRAIDAHTVELVARDVFATFIDNTVALVAILPKHIWQDVPPADWGTDPGSTGSDPSRVVGTGPGIFVEWVAGDHVTIRKNPDYWDVPRQWTVDEWIYRVMPDASAATQALLAGEIDIVLVNSAEAPTLEGSDNIDLHVFDTSSVNFYAAIQDPERTELFLDMRVRQALMLALDRQLLAEQVYNGYAIPANGTQPVLSIAYRPELTRTIFEYDIDRARSLLEEAGWIEGSDGIREKDGVKFSFECLFSDGVASFEQQLPYMQQTWAEVGIEMMPAAVPFPTLQAALISGSFDMALLGFAWGSSPDGNQQAMFGCDFVPPHGFNSMRYCNEEYDRLSLEAAQTLPRDSEERISLVIEASNIVNDEQAAGYLFFRQQIIGSSARVHNFYPNGHSPTWSMPFVWTENQP